MRISLWIKGSQCVRLTTSLPCVSLVSRKCEQPWRHVTGMLFLLFFLILPFLFWFLHYHIIQKMQLCHKCASLHQPCTCTFHIGSQLLLGNPSFCNPAFQSYSVLCIIEQLKVLWQQWETKYSKLICSLKAGDLNLLRQRATFTFFITSWICRLSILKISWHFITIS